MSSSNKSIYRDKETGRLITRQEAERRDPFTFVEEKFHVVEDHGPDWYDEPNYASSGGE